MTQSKNTNFDIYGRCTPGNIPSSAHEQSRRYFIIEQPEIDYKKCYERLDTAFNLASEISCTEFQTRVEAIIDNLAQNEESRNILNGVMVPFILPKDRVDDIGDAVDSRYLPALSATYQTSFPNFSFTNHNQSALSGKLNITPSGRHEKLLKAMSTDVVVGIYFPSLLEYSVPASIEKVASLSENFLLSGAVDTIAALVSLPSLLMRRDGYPPLLWLSGVTPTDEKVGYHFEAYGYDLTFNRRVHLDQVAEYWASAITVIEEANDSAEK